MGYYSDVAISIHQKDFDTLCDRVATSKIEDKETLERVSGMIQSAEIELIRRWDPDESIVTMSWASWKWYEGFAEVDYLMNFLREDGRRYCFKRIGETLGDYEEEDGDYDPDLCEAVSAVTYLSLDERGVPFDEKSKKEKLEPRSGGESIDARMTFDDIGG